MRADLRPSPGNNVALCLACPSGEGGLTADPSVGPGRGAHCGSSPVSLREARQRGLLLSDCAELAGPSCSFARRRGFPFPSGPGTAERCAVRLQPSGSQTLSLAVV